MNRLKTTARQAYQGSTAGFGDEAYDALGALYASSLGGGDFKDLYNEARGLSKKELASDIKNYPGTSIAANILGSLPLGMGVGSGLVRQTALGASQGVGSSDGDLSDRATGGFIGSVFGLGGQALASGANRIAKGASDLITPEVRKTAQKLKSMGIPVRLSQLADSKFLSAIDTALPKVPFSGASESQAAQRQAFTRELAKTFGETADNINPDVLGSAKERLGSAYGNLLNGKDIPIDRRQFSQQLSQVVDDLALETDDVGAEFIKKQANNILNTLDNNGNLSGSSYQKLRQTLKGASKQSYSVNQLKNLLDETVRQNVSGDIGSELSKIDGQYRNMKIAEKLYGQLQNSSGEIKPETLYNAAKSSISNLAYGGGGELGDLARGGRLLKQTVPDSGTATQLLGAGALGGAGVGAMINPAFAAGALGTVGAANGINRAMTSEYLQNGLSPAIQSVAQGVDSSNIIPSTARSLVQNFNTTDPYDPNNDPLLNSYNTDNDPELKKLMQSRPYNPDEDPELQKLLKGIR